ncbi:MAG: FtsX-like permease family protein [Candidatus Latescibacteria bacterium]|nr:FtsX-like permease family protein [Candidatus Latescibacterota bacterium]
MGDRKDYGPSCPHLIFAKVQLFTFHFLSGDQSALEAPGTVVLTQSFAQALMGPVEALGATVQLAGGDYVVAAVIEDPPARSHFHFDYLGSLVTFYGPDNWLGQQLENWGNGVFYTYLLLADKADPQAVTSHLADLVATGAEIDRDRVGVRLQPLKSIHLHSHLKGELGENTPLYILHAAFALGAGMLLMGAINFINLTNARSLRRRIEVGTRKAMGARRGQLMVQFLSEATMLSIAAIAIGLAIVELLAPYLRQLTGTQLETNYRDPRFLAGIAGLVLCVSCLSGVYPALLLSRRRPVDALLGGGRGQGGHRPASLLIVVQFCISVLLLIGTVIVHTQLGFLRQKPVGFDRDQVAVLHTDAVLQKHYGSVRAALLQNPDITAVAAAASVPGRHMDAFSFRDGEGQDWTQVWETRVDAGFIESLGLEIVAGRDFRHGEPEGTCLISERAVQDLGLGTAAQALGQQVRVREKEVVGVFADYHVESLHQPMRAVLLHYDIAPRYIAVRARAGAMASAVEHLRETAADFSPGLQHKYFLLDRELERLYRSEQRLAGVLEMCSAIVVLIACVGLFALTSYIVEQRKKEIGVRKVLGASLTRITWMLTRQFVGRFMLANLIALPLAYWASERWLQNFAYRIEFSFAAVLTAVAAASVLALATVAYRAQRAAMANPVESLRCD